MMLFLHDFLQAVSAMNPWTASVLIVCTAAVIIACVIIACVIYAIIKL